MLLNYDKITIHTIRDVYNEILNEFNIVSDYYEIDMQNIDEIDLSGLQALISLKKSCIESNKEFKLINIKDELLYAFELSGTAKFLEV